MADLHKHWRKLERLYIDAPTNAYYQPTIRIGDGVTEISIDVRQDFFHAAGAVHGSIYFKLLDDSGYFAINSLVTDSLVLTGSFTIHLLHPVSTGRLTARGKLLHLGKRQSLAESHLFDADERLVGHGVGSYISGKVPLATDCE